MAKIGNIQKRTLHFVLDDFESDYETLLNNPSYLQNMFIKRNNTRRRENDIQIPTRNTVRFGVKIVGALGPHI